MPRRRHGPRAPYQLDRRGFLQGALGSTAVLLLSACGGATAPAPPEAKPTEAAKPAAPAAQPAATAAPAKPTEAQKPAAAAPTQAAPAAKAPISLKGVSLSIVQGSSFVPAADPFLTKQIQDGFMKDTGAQVTMEYIGNNDVQPKIAASIQSGAGPDIVMLNHNWAWLYKESLVDVSDVAADVKQITGDFYPLPEAYSNVEGKYLAIPRDIVGTAFHWRKSWFKEVGVETWPATIDELHDAGKKLKAKGHPLGASLGHSTGDPVFWTYPMIWMYGGQEVDQNGKVAINSPGTVAAIKAVKDAWTEAYDETGLSWDDGANNRAFLAETVSATQNGASIYWVASNEKMPFVDDIGLDLFPAGPKGQIVLPSSEYYAIMKYSKNVDAAKEWLRWCMSELVWNPWFELSNGFYAGVGPKQDASAPWDKFAPVLQVFKKSGAMGRPLGYPGPADQKVALVQSKYIIVDMFARAVQGESPEAAVAWAETEMKQVYGQ